MKNIKSKYKHCCQEKGSTLIEGAIVFPLMLLIVLSLIDVALYFTTQSVATQAASRAAFLASTAVGLDSADPVERNLALQKVREEAVDYALSTNFLGDPRQEDTFGRALSLVIPDESSLISFGTSTGQAYWPADTNNLTSPVSIFFPYDIYSSELSNNTRALHEALTDQPMEIQVHAQSFSIFLGYIFGHQGKFEITEHVFAYRQPSNEPAQPTPIDCGGDSGAYLRGECSCGDTEPGKVYDPTLDRCVCKQGTFEQEDGGCGCPTGGFNNSYENYLGETVCYCETWRASTCESSETFNPETCSCESDGCTDIGGENYVLNSETGRCQCDPRGCGYFQAYTNVFDCSSCETCEDGKIGSQSKDACECQIKPEYCSAAETHSDETCTCSCDADNFEANKTSCVYSGQNKIFESYESGGVDRCRCRDCWGGTVPDEEKESCVCDTDKLTDLCAERGLLPSQWDEVCTCMQDVCEGNLEANTSLGGQNLYYATLSKFYKENYGLNIFTGYGDACVCPVSIKENCEGSFNEETCSCEPCADGFSPDGAGTCRCDNADATKVLCDSDAGISFNPETCACQICPADQIVTADGEGCEPCDTGNSNYVRADGTNECECNLDFSGETVQSYGHGGVKSFLDEDSCSFVDCEQERSAGSPRAECECPADAKFYCNEDGRAWDETTCKCETIPCGAQVDEQGNTFFVLNAEGTGCSCGNKLEFQAECLARGIHWRFDEGSCQCDLCPGNQTGNTDNFFCGCDAENIPSCPADEGKNLSSCDCSPCSGQKVQGTDGFCECAADAGDRCMALGRPFNPGQCNCGAPCEGSEEIDTDTYECFCPASVETDCTDGIFDADTCTCVPCPSGQSKVGNECVCDVIPTCLTGEYFNSESCSCDTCSEGMVPNVPDRTACISCPTNYTSNPVSPDNCMCDITCGVTERMVTEDGACGCEPCEPGLYQNSSDPTAACQCPVDTDCDNYDVYACRCVDDEMSSCTVNGIAQLSASCCGDGEFVAATTGVGGYCNPANCLNCELTDEEISKCLGELKGSPGCEISQSER